MPGKITMKVRGVAELERKLKEFPRKVRNKVIRQAARKGAKLIADQARDNMPVDTGTAKKAITVRAAKGRKRGMIKYNVIFRTEPIKEASKKPSQPEGFFYPAVIEYGAPQEGIPASAPMRRAFESTGPQAAEQTAAEIAQGIEREETT